jgi:hypothetical protein
MEAIRALTPKGRRSGPQQGQPVDAEPGPTVRVSAVELSHTVAVQYEVSLTRPNGAPGRALVRVQFPDEVRAMLETSTWSRGATILESIASLGTAYLGRLVSAGLLSGADDGRTMKTFHLPLADLRSSFTAAVGSGQ